MSKKNYTVQWARDTTVTAGNGSISIADTKTGGTDTATIYNNTVYGAGEYEWPAYSIGEQNSLHINLSDELRSELVRIVKEISLEAFHPKSDSIPIEWIRKYLHKLEIISKDNLDLGEDGYFGDVVAIENMLYAWEKENETN